MREDEGSLFKRGACLTLWTEKGGGGSYSQRAPNRKRIHFLGKTAFGSKHFIRAMWRMQCEISTYCMCTTFKSGLSVHVSIRNMHFPWNVLPTFLHVKDTSCHTIQAHNTFMNLQLFDVATYIHAHLYAQCP